MVFVKKLCKGGQGQIFSNMSEFDEAASTAEPADANVITMEEYLKSWGLSMYIDKFKEQCIDIETLQILSPDDIKDLIPVIGHRAKLTTQIAMLKNIVTDAFSAANKTTEEVGDISMNAVYLIDNSSYELDQQANESATDAEFQREQRKQCKLYETLLKYNDGKGLLLRYEENGLLDNAARRRLCNIIINDELKDDPEKTISSSRLYQLAFEITQVFHKESSSVYFIPFTSFSPNQKTSAKGKLLDCYRQRRRAYIKSGVIRGREKRSSSATSNYSEPESPRPSTSAQTLATLFPDQLESDVQEKLLWLKNCCDPWETVESYWIMTTRTRLNLLKSNDYTIQQYYSEFKALNQPGGIFLLLKDYTSLYPNNPMLTENWLLIRPKLIELAKKRSDAILKDVLADIELETREEVLDVAAFMAIPFLMTTSNVKKTTNSDSKSNKTKTKSLESKSKDIWRPSKQEVLEGFITHVKSAAQIEDTIARKEKKLRELKLTMQPSIIIVGPSVKEVTARYLIINDVRYEVPSILKAVDACFKTIFVLNAQYPAECKNVWQFLQMTLFKLKTEYDKIYTTVNTLMTDLNVNQLGE